MPPSPPASSAPASRPNVPAASGLPAEWKAATLSAALQFEMRSAHTGRQYRILIGLPGEPAPATGYPTLWMLDGSASFPLASASLGRAVRHVPEARRPAPPAMPAGLTIAVAHAGACNFDVDARACDYTPEPDGAPGDLLSPAFGGAAAFRRFLVEELRPLIAARFPLDASRHTLFGFSYGGLFTVDTLCTAPAHFQRYWAASPSLWFSDALPMRRLRKSARLPAGQVARIMLTVGREEQFPAAALPPERLAHLERRAMVGHVSEAAALLATANPGVTVQSIIAADHDHFDMLMHGARRAIAFAFGD